MVERVVMEVLLVFSIVLLIKIIKEVIYASKFYNIFMHNFNMRWDFSYFIKTINSITGTIVSEKMRLKKVSVNISNKKEYNKFISELITSNILRLSTSNDIFITLRYNNSESGVGFILKSLINGVEINTFHLFDESDFYGQANYKDIIKLANLTGEKINKFKWELTKDKKAIYIKEINEFLDIDM